MTTTPKSTYINNKIPAITNAEYYHNYNEITVTQYNNNKRLIYHQLPSIKDFYSFYIQHKQKKTIIEASQRSQQNINGKEHLRLYIHQPVNKLQQHKQKWFYKYNDSTAKQDDVLLKNITVYPSTIIVASKINGTNTFTKFASIDKFFQFFIQTPPEQRVFYAVLYKNTRRIYMDIDYQLTKPLSNKQQNKLIKSIYSDLITFTTIYGYKYGINIHKCNWYIWNGSRNNKFSLHIMDTYHCCHFLINKTLAIDFNHWLHRNNKIPSTCKIDDNIYHHGYQLWRLPACHSGNNSSTLQLYNSTLSIYEQIQISFMNDCHQPPPSCKQIKNNIQNKITTPSKQFNNNITRNQIQTTKIKPKIQEDTFNQLQQMLKTNNITPYHNGELLIKKGWCQTANRRHKNNSGRVLLCYVTRPQAIKYIRWTCMDDECKLQYKTKLITINNEWKYPWIFKPLSKHSQITNAIMKKVHTFFQQLFDTNMLQIQKGTHQNTIIQQNNLSVNTEDYIINGFLYNNIEHTGCYYTKCMKFHYRNPTHKYYFYGEICLYCPTCK